MQSPAIVAADLAKDDRHADEVGLLGALIVYGDPTLFRQASAICAAAHFCDPFHARLWDTLRRGIDANLSGFPLTHWIITQISQDPVLPEIKITASVLVARYCSHAFPAIGVEGCARQVKHWSLKSDLSIAVEEGDTASAETIAAEMERLTRAHLSKDEGIQHIGASADAVLESLSKAYADGGAAEDYAYAGSSELARTIGGWRQGRFYVLAGRPGMGKTTTGLSWVLRTAAKDHGVMFFSLEMSKEELTEIALCDLAWSRTRRIEYREISAAATQMSGFEERYRVISEASRRLSATPLTISDRAGQTVADIRSQAQAYAQRLEAQGKRLEVIIIDHLNLIRASDRYQGSKVAETEEVSAALKQLAKELHCAVIWLCQLNRGVEVREEKRPGLADLRWSGAIEQDADVVMFVYREAYYLERAKHDDFEKDAARLVKLETCRNRLGVTFGKHRGGPCRRCNSLPTWAAASFGIWSRGHGGDGLDKVLLERLEQ